MYVFGATLTALGIIAFRLTGKYEDKYIKLSNAVSPTEMQIRDSKKYKKYLKLRKAFLILSGLAIVLMSMFVEG